MKVLLISKALVAGPYQKKLEELSREPDVELRAVVPPYWRTGKTKAQLRRMHVDGYELRVRSAVLNGHFHVHFYPRIGAEIADFRPDLVHIDEEPYNLATVHAIKGCRTTQRALRIFRMAKPRTALFSAVLLV